MTLISHNDDDIDVCNPLLTSSEPPVDTPSPDEEAEEEVKWLAHLQRLPWYKRPSVDWMMPMLFLLSMTVNAIVSPKEQLAIRIICKDFYTILSPASGQFLALGEDTCKQPAVLAAAALLHSRVGAIKGILSKSSFPSCFWSSGLFVEKHV